MNKLENFIVFSTVRHTLKSDKTLRFCGIFESSVGSTLCEARRQWIWKFQ